MPGVMHLYIDDSGARHPDKDPGARPARDALEVPAEVRGVEGG